MGFDNCFDKLTEEAKLVPPKMPREPKNMIHVNAIHELIDKGYGTKEIKYWFEEKGVKIGNTFLYKECAAYKKSKKKNAASNPD